MLGNSLSVTVVEASERQFTAHLSEKNFDIECRRYSRGCSENLRQFDSRLELYRVMS